MYSKVINTLESRFEFQQSTFTCDILFARCLNFCGWFTENINIFEPNKIK